MIAIKSVDDLSRSVQGAASRLRRLRGGQEGLGRAGFATLTRATGFGAADGLGLAMVLEWLIGLDGNPPTAAGLYVRYQLLEWSGLRILIETRLSKDSRQAGRRSRSY